MGKKLNPSFVEYFAGYLKKLLSKTTGTITAKDFQEHVTTAANVYLNENYGADPTAVRSAIAQSTPENECTNAIKARIKYEIGDDNRITFYKNQAQISSETKEETLESAKKDHLEVKVWTSKTNMLLPDASGRKRQQAVEFRPVTAVKCGKCWICMTDVMSYSGNSINKYNDHDIQDDNGTPIECTTPCGDCEHVSAIMASYIAGMLTSSGFAKVYWASYYVACVECNRRKSNYIGVKLNATEGWQVDDNGVNAIVDAIFPMNGVDQHASEYNPIRNALSDKYNVMTPAEKRAFRDKVNKNIKLGTETWCFSANTNMKKDTATTKRIKMSFNVSKIIVAITGHLNVITGPLQKRANKAVKAGRTPVKPKLGKIRGGGPPGPGESGDSDDLMEGIGAKDTQRKDTENSQDTMVEGASSDDEEDSQESVIVNVMPVKTVVNPPILNWYNLIGEAEIDDEINDEDDRETDDDEYDNMVDKEDDRETDAEFNVRILKYCDVIVEYIGNTYSQLLFKQYESDPTIFEELMVNLSKSMYDTLESTNEGLPKLTDEDLDYFATKFAETGLKVAGLKVAGLKTAFVTPSKLTSGSDQSESQGIFFNNPAKSSGDKLATVVSQGSEDSVFAFGTPLKGQPSQQPVVVMGQRPNKRSLEKDDRKVSTLTATDEYEGQTAKMAKGGSSSSSERMSPQYAADNDANFVSQEGMEVSAATDSSDQSAQTSVFESIADLESAKNFEKRSSSSTGRMSAQIEEGGSRINKRHSKNRTKRISYIKHKQTRKNQHSRKTK